MKRLPLLLFATSLLLSAAVLLGADLASEGIHTLDPRVVQQRDNKIGPAALSEQIPSVGIFPLYRSNTSTYYLSSGAVGDTFAVYLKPFASCSLYYVLQNWYDPGEVEAYLWEANPAWLEEFPGGRVNADNGARGTVHTSPIGEVIVGPINAVSEDYSWQTLMDWELLHDTEMLYRREGTGFLAGFVKKGDDPHPLSSGVLNYCYTWFGGPWALPFNDTNACWGMYSSTSPLDLNLVVGVAYTVPQLDMYDTSILPNTVNGNKECTAYSWIYDPPGGWTENDHAWLVWKAVDGSGTTLQYDSVEVFDPDGNDYFYGTIPGMGLASGSVVYYWFTARDDEDNYATVKHMNYHYTILEPVDESKTILWMNEREATLSGIDGSSTYAVLQQLGLLDRVERYDVLANNGFDQYLLNQKSWATVLYTASGTKWVPRISLDENWFSDYLENGGTLILSDPDYPLRRDEFTTGFDQMFFGEGDFAYDVFGMSSVTPNPQENNSATGDSTFWGTGGTATEMFLSEPYALEPYSMIASGYRRTNPWSDPMSPVDSLNNVLFTGTHDGAVYGLRNELEGGGIAYYFSFDMPFTSNPNHVSEEGYPQPTRQHIDLLEALLLDAGVGSPESVNGFSEPKTYSLHPNYPNPFNPSTEIRFALPEAGAVNVAVYNLIGQKIATLAEGRFEAGTHKVSFNGSELPSGVYLCRMTSGSFAQTRKLVLVK